MANYTINTAGSTTCNYPSTVNANDVLTFNITRTTTTTKYQGSMLTYIFPCDCTAEILAAGARGGRGANVATTATGRGAIVAGTFEFKTGDQLLICVGQAGTDHPYATSMTDDDGTVGAGGGGTYVVKKVSLSSYRYTGSGTGNNWYVEPLVIGAGGNGSGDNGYSGNVQVHGTSSQGNEGTFSFSSSNNGGCFSKEPSSGFSNYNGYSFLKGALGASSYFDRGGTSYAGFGGGSSNWDDGAYGAPGGGFTGGFVADDVVYAATSYIATNATNTSRKSGSSQGNNGEGYVKITFKTVVPPHDFPEDQVVTMAGFNAKVKTNDSWKDGTKGYVKVNNAWKEISKMYTKVNNQWVLTGEEKQFTVQTLLHEGFLNAKTIVGEYNGTATYSAYTAGTGVQLYVAASSWNSQYPTAVGNFVNHSEVVNNIKSITFDFTRTSGNTEFQLGIYLSQTAQTGRLNSTNTNTLIRAYKTFNAASGTVTLDLEEEFGDALESYKNYYIGFYLNNPSNAATTVVIKNAQVSRPKPPYIMVLENGVLNTGTLLGNYNGENTYSPYTAGTGITLYKAQGYMWSSYPGAVGYFANKTSGFINNIKTITFDYERTAGSGNIDLGICLSTTATSGRLDDNSVNSLPKKIVQTINSASGTITLDLEEALGNELSTFNNHYLGLFAYQSGTSSFTIVLKNISYIEKNASSSSSNGPIGTELGFGYYDMNTPFAWTEGTNMLSSGKILLKDVYNQYGENVKFTLTSTANDLLNMTVLQGKYYATSDGTENGISNAGPIYFFFEGDDTDQTVTKNLIHTANTVSFTMSLPEFTSLMGGAAYDYLFISIESSFNVSALSNYKLTIESAPTSSSIFPVKNVRVYNDTEFGALTTSYYVTDNSGGMGIKVVTRASDLYAYTTRFSFDKKFDMSKIEKIIMKWTYTDSSLTGKTGEIFIGCTSTTYNSQGNTNDFVGKLTKAITLSGQNVIETIEFVPTNWTGENYLSIGVCPSTNTALTIGIVELEIVLKAGSGSGGSSSSDNTITAIDTTLRFGYYGWNIGEQSTFNTDDETITTNLINLGDLFSCGDSFTFKFESYESRDITTNVATYYISPHYRSGSIIVLGNQVMELNDGFNVSNLSSYAYETSFEISTAHFYDNAVFEDFIDQYGLDNIYFTIEIDKENGFGSDSINDYKFTIASSGNSSGSGGNQTIPFTLQKGSYTEYIGLYDPIEFNSNEKILTTELIPLQALFNQYGNNIKFKISSSASNQFSQTETSGYINLCFRNDYNNNNQICYDTYISIEQELDVEYLVQSRSYTVTFTKTDLTSNENFADFISMACANDWSRAYITFEVSRQTSNYSSSSSFTFTINDQGPGGSGAMPIDDI